MLQTNTSRISVLAYEKRLITRLHVYHNKTCLFLCLSSQELGMLLMPAYHPLFLKDVMLNSTRGKSPNQVTYRNEVRKIRNITGTGFD